MKTVTLTGGALHKLWKSLPEVHPKKRVPVGLLVKLRRLRAAVAEYHDPWIDQLRPMIAKHTDGAETIAAGHPNRAAFDEEAKGLLEEEVEIEVEPIGLDVLAACDAVLLTGEGLEVLLQVGVVEEGSSS